ncbi:MAG: YggS family pyridoxal phosphate-dependent enzyme [Oscillospiraceae bacterium]|nr:YggS family pyridoxal phosphate-dependent enzyme [Oscillospiraceae bacterium]
MTTSIAENIQAVRERMAQAARRAGRDPDQVLLVGASKMNGAEACRAAIAAGIDALGENRVQEMTGKLAERAYGGAPLHFIGHLQRNKVRQVVGRVSLIQSAGSLALLEEIDRQAEKLALVQDVLLEVNVGGEESKSGFPPGELAPAAEKARAFSHVRVLGLMTIPPIQQEIHGNFSYFEKVARMYVDINRNLYDNSFKFLSMGMSDDFEDAIAAGATMVRVGSAIFGHRQY